MSPGWKRRSRLLAATQHFAIDYGTTSAGYAPVSFAYHPPWCPHAIESVADEPLVIVYLWWGDREVLAADAELVPDDG